MASRGMRGAGLTPSTQRVAAAIHRYCVAHPNSRDTIKGIAWWVEMERQHEVRSMVAEAVQLLLEQGVLERFVLKDGSEVFGCKRRDRDDPS
jgi:hypothetical protein